MKAFYDKEKLKKHFIFFDKCYIIIIIVTVRKRYGRFKKKDLLFYGA